MQRIQTNLEEIRQKKLVGTMKAHRGEIDHWLGTNDAEGGGMLFWSFLIELPGQISEVTLVCQGGRTGEQAFNVYASDESVMGLVELARGVHRDMVTDSNPIASLFSEFERITDEVEAKHDENTARLVRIAFHASKASEVVGMLMQVADGMPKEAKDPLGKAFAKIMVTMIDEAVVISGKADEEGNTPPELAKIITSTVDKMHSAEKSVAQRIAASDDNGE